MVYGDLVNQRNNKLKVRNFVIAALVETSTAAAMQRRNDAACAKHSHKKNFGDARMIQHGCTLRMTSDPKTAQVSSFFAFVAPSCESLQPVTSIKHSMKPQKMTLKAMEGW